MSRPLPKNDPAYWMLEKGLEKGSDWVTDSTVWNDECYICLDPEFAVMGLPTCYPCPECGAHTPADDVICDEGHDVQEGR